MMRIYVLVYKISGSILVSSEFDVVTFHSCQLNIVQTTMQVLSDLDFLLWSCIMLVQIGSMIDQVPTQCYLRS